MRQRSDAGIPAAAPCRSSAPVADEREDRGNRRVIAAFDVRALLNDWLPAYTGRIGFRALDGDTVRWVGVVVFVVGSHGADPAQGAGDQR